MNVYFDACSSLSKDYLDESTNDIWKRNLVFLQTFLHYPKLFGLNNIHKLSRDGSFAAERSRGTKSPNWRANGALGHVKQRKFKFGGFVKHVPVRHLLSSLAILYHVIAKLQRAH